MRLRLRGPPSTITPHRGASWDRPWPFLSLCPRQARKSKEPVCHAGPSPFSRPDTDSSSAGLVSVCTDIPRPHAAERPARPQVRRAETGLPVCPGTGPRPAPTPLSVQLLPPALGPELTSELGRFPQGCARGVGARVPSVATAGVARAAGCFAGLRARGGAPPRGTGLLALTPAVTAGAEASGQSAGRRGFSKRRWGGGHSSPSSGGTGSPRVRSWASLSSARPCPVS